MDFENFEFFTKFAHVDKILTKIDILKFFCLAFRMSEMIPYVFDSAGLAKFSKSVRELKTGGKPSTWLPPGRLVELRKTQKSSRGQTS